MKTRLLIALIMIIAAATAWAELRLKPVHRQRDCKEHYVKDGMVAWMDVDVHEVLGGYAERGVIRIFGDWGRLCRPSLAMFPVTVTEAPFRFEGL
ncbi:MAG: hypothetical protein NT072_11565 [Deltaproteobacteria bacterium]|nr:hypothetical protein [Deltaproteobacteria bacterium]